MKRSKAARRADTRELTVITDFLLDDYYLAPAEKTAA